MGLTSLSSRITGPELMDQPGLDPSEHECALAGLGRLNIASGVCHQVWREIQRRTNVRAGGSLRLLDIASGGGDVAFGLWKLARRQGVELEILGLDLSAAGCVHAARHCRSAGDSITFEYSNVLTENLPTGFDVVMSTLFLHHLSAEDATKLLAKMAAAGELVIVSDLKRSRVGYAVALAACHLLSRSSMVHHDGPQSVRNAFTASEMRGLCAAAGLSNTTIRSAWPWRLMVVFHGA